MKHKLEKLLREHNKNQAHHILLCCQCSGIKLDNGDWIDESKAHQHGVHHIYEEILLTKRITHGYCLPCYNLVMKRVDAQYKSQKHYAQRKL
jgi:hypothetical protein